MTKKSISFCGRFILCEKNLGLLDFPSGYSISRSGSPAGYRSKKLSSTPEHPNNTNIELVYVNDMFSIE